MRSLRHEARMPALSRALGAALVALLVSAANSLPSAAGEVKAAVAANFTEAAKEIGVLFEKATGNKAVFSFGATGQLYTQITQEAPFEVFLSADQKTPKKAVDWGSRTASSPMPPESSCSSARTRSS
jgi:molybdate transport system substrate-binding protein